VIRYRNFGNGPMRPVAKPAPADSAPLIPIPDAALAEAVASQAGYAGPVLHDAETKAETFPAAFQKTELKLPQPRVDWRDIGVSSEDAVRPATMQNPVAPPEDTPVGPRAFAPSPDRISTPFAPLPEPVMPPPVVAMPPPVLTNPVAYPFVPQAAALDTATPRAELPRQSLLGMLQDPAPRDQAGASPAAARSLLEELRVSSARNTAPRDGLLASLAQPAVWDLPLAAPAAISAPMPLVGQPIPPLDMGQGGLLASGLGAAARAPVTMADLPLHQPPQAPRPAMPEPVAAPPAEWRDAGPVNPPRTAAVEPLAAAAGVSHRPNWRAALAATETVPPQTQPAQAQPAFQRPAMAAVRASGSLADMFRMVATPAPQSSPPADLARTNALQDVLRGLHPAKRG
jgi:hypothetical protein